MESSKSRIQAYLMNPFLIGRCFVGTVNSLAEPFAKDGCNMWKYFSCAVNKSATDTLE